MRNLAGLTAAALSLILVSLGFAGGEVPAGGAAKPIVKIYRPESDSVTKLKKYYSSRLETVRKTQTETFEIADEAYRKLSKVTVVVGRDQDRFGDPMYVKYGPLPYAGSPMYTGPRYVASFDPYDHVMVPDSEHRGYYRQRYSHPSLHARTGTTLGVGASHSYMQHGMMWAPGSMAPSAARVITNNRW